LLWERENVFDRGCGIRETLRCQKNEPTVASKYSNKTTKEAKEFKLREKKKMSQRADPE
jgi:hypothetical protein